MTDALSVLDMTRKKLKTKIERLRAQLEAAETEFEESVTAIRVLTRLGLSPMVEAPPAEEARGNSQARVLEVLPWAEAAAKAPKEIHAALVEAGITNITSDNVRTILSRLTKLDANGKAPVLSKDSRYWRTEGERPVEPQADPEDDFVTSFDAEDDTPFGVSSRPQPVFDDDLDDSVPF